MPTPPPAWEVPFESSDGRASARDVWTSEGVERYAVVDREVLTQHPSEGPLIIEQADSTIVVPRDWRISEVAAGTALVERTRT
jgi:N-methylhydantoinase A/oxoprolinase/acetone carboxylase beta subunit